MSSHYEAPIREPLVLGDKSYHDISVDVAAPVLGKANKSWWIVFTIALVAFLWGLGCIIYTVSTGIGVWGLNKTIGWAWDITNFVWWVGIGHAGTLISAVLLLFRQKWRMAVNRSAEAMTIFAVVQAGLPLASFSNAARVLLALALGASVGLALAYSDPALGARTASVRSIEDTPAGVSGRTAAVSCGSCGGIG